MRPLRYSINVTLDGCCDHRAISPDEETHRHATKLLAEADALLFGRVTYEMMESAWRPPGQLEAMPDWMAPFARTIDAAKKYVVSSTLDQVDWNAELLRGDLGEAVRELKRESGKGLAVGGVKLPLALAELGLIDEYEFVVHPTLVGHGPTLFSGLSKRVDLKLVGRLELGSGAVAMRYEPRKSAQANQPLMDISENVQIIRALSDAFNRRDYKAVLDAIDPEVEWHPPPDIPNAAVAIGRDALIANFQDWFGAWEDYRSEPEEVLDGGDDTVVLCARESARGKGSGIELRSRRIFGVFRLRDGKVVRQQAFLDRGDALRAAGLPESAEG